MIKKNDYILIGIILIICLGAIIFIYTSRSDGRKLITSIDGVVYKTFDLDKDITYTINTDSGGTNTFTIKDGSVTMTDASCPDGYCVQHKSIQYQNETIVCLPNRVVLEISGGEENPIDTIVN